MKFGEIVGLDVNRGIVGLVVKFAGSKVVSGVEAEV